MVKARFLVNQQKWPVVKTFLGVHENYEFVDCNRSICRSKSEKPSRIKQHNATELSGLGELVRSKLIDIPT